MKTKEPSQKALIAAANLGKRMAKEDHWIEPCFEEGDDREDYGQAAMAHRGQWEETCQFQLLWGNQLRDLAEEEAERKGVNRIDNWEAYHYGFYEPMLNEFWDAWENEVDLYKAWEEFKSETGS